MVGDKEVKIIIILIIMILTIIVNHMIEYHDYTFAFLLTIICCHRLVPWLSVLLYHRIAATTNTPAPDSNVLPLAPELCSTITSTRSCEISPAICRPIGIAAA